MIVQLVCKSTNQNAKKNKQKEIDYITFNNMTKNYSPLHNRLLVNISSSFSDVTTTLHIKIDDCGANNVKR